MGTYDELVINFTGFYYLQDFFSNTLEPGITKVEIPPQASIQSGSQISKVVEAFSSMIGVLYVASLLAQVCVTASLNFVFVSIV